MGDHGFYSDFAVRVHYSENWPEETGRGSPPPGIDLCWPFS